MKRIVVLLFAVLLTSGCASVPRKVWTAPVSYNFHLQKQGPFVEYPTVAGFIVGMPAMLIAVPLMPFLEPETGEGAGWSLLLLGPSLVGDITGTPFLALRRTLWDFPKWCVQPKKKEESANNELQATNQGAP